MHKLGIIQTSQYSSNYEAIQKISKMLYTAAKKEAEIVCLPEQWLVNNKITDYSIFNGFKKIAKEHRMTIIVGAFYEKQNKHQVISAPIIGPDGHIIGKQEKIHPFDYENKLVKAGKKTKIFKTFCKFGVIVCYDMVFPKVAESLTKKGAQVLFSTSRIVKRGIIPWHIYVQARALENRIPILAANISSNKYGGQSIIIDLKEMNQIMVPRVFKCRLSSQVMIKEFDLKKLQKERRKRYSDARNFS